MSEVWVVQTGDYEDRHVRLVADSMETAIAALKADYADYPVTWHEPQCYEYTGGRGVQWSIEGDFEFKAGKCFEHTGYFTFDPYPLRNAE